MANTATAIFNRSIELITTLKADKAALSAENETLKGIISTATSALASANDQNDALKVEYSMLTAELAPYKFAEAETQTSVDNLAALLPTEPAVVEGSALEPVSSIEPVAPISEADVIAVPLTDPNLAPMGTVPSPMQ